MYLVYLSTLIALSTGIGAFVQLDTAMTQQDAATKTRVEVQSAQQEQLSRALRRQYQIDPTSFPAPAPGTFTRLSSTILERAAAGGLVILDTSDYYIGDTGEVIAVLKEGPASPESLNGDRDLGVMSRPQFLEDFLAFLFGSHYERGPGVAASSGNDIAWSSLTGGDTLSAELLSHLGEESYATVAQLSLPSVTPDISVDLEQTPLSYFSETDFTAISQKYGIADK